VIPKGEITETRFGYPFPKGAFPNQSSKMTALSEIVGVRQLKGGYDGDKKP